MLPLSTTCDARVNRLHALFFVQYFHLSRSNRFPAAGKWDPQGVINTHVYYICSKRAYIPNMLVVVYIVVVAVDGQLHGLWLMNFS